MANSVSVSAVPFNPQTQTFGSTQAPTNQYSMGTVNLNTSSPTQTQAPSVVTPTSLPKTQQVSTLNTQPVQLPTPKTQSYNIPNNLALSGFQSIPTPVTDAANNISSTMLQLIPQLSGQTTELINQQNNAGLPQLRQNLQDISNQVVQKTAELNQEDVALAQGLQNVQDQAIPMQFITGQQASIQNRAQLAKAVKVSNINMLNAQALAAQGNISLAQQTAQQAVDLKYAPIKDMYNTLQAQLEVIQPLLSQEEKKIATQQAAMYDLQKTMLTNKQNQESKFMDLVLKAPTDYGSSPDQVAKAISVYQQTGDAMQAAQALTGTGGSAISSYYGTQDASRNALYNSVGQITVDNGYDLNAFKKGIAGVESGSNYNAIGPATSTGDKAYGKYQVMGANIPSWTKAATGTAMTIDQFLKSPDAQEKVFENQALTNYAKYGNWDDVASVWFSGKPLSKNTSSDGYNTVPQYVAKVRANMGVPTQPTTLSTITNPTVKTFGDEYIRLGRPADYLKTLPKYVRQEDILAYANQNVQNTPQVQSLVEKINNIDSLISSPYMGSVVGPNFLTRGATSNVLAGATVGGTAGAIGGSFVPVVGNLIGGVGGAVVGGLAGGAMTPQFSGKASSYIADVELLTSQETIDNLIKTKSQGATFGALSESEQKMLREAATKINNWAVREGGKQDGKVLYYDVDEESFLNELNRIKTLAQKGIVNAGGNILGGTVTDVYYKNISQPLNGMSTTTSYGYQF